MPVAREMLESQRTKDYDLVFVDDANDVSDVNGQIGRAHV